MLKKFCRECGAEMTRKYLAEGVTIFCEACDSAGAYDEIEMEPYCPDCGEMVTVYAKCGEGYFCNKCNSLKSSKKIIWKEAQAS